MAKITVRLPEDARLFVDNVLCPLTSDSRTFTTPQLQPGRRYFYTIRTEVVRNGQIVAQNHKVILAAGQQIVVDLNNSGSAQTAQK